MSGRLTVGCEGLQPLPAPRHGSSPWREEPKSPHSILTLFQGTWPTRGTGCSGMGT